MAQYDVFRGPSGDGYLLDVQTNFLDGLETRTVVPLMLVEQAPTRSLYLNPTFELDDLTVVMVTQYIAAVLKSELGLPIASLSAYRDEITRALDRLLNDF